MRPFPARQRHQGQRPHADDGHEFRRGVRAHPELDGRARSDAVRDEHLGGRWGIMRLAKVAGFNMFARGPTLSVRASTFLEVPCLENATEMGGCTDLFQRKSRSPRSAPCLAALLQRGAPSNVDGATAKHQIWTLAISTGHRYICRPSSRDKFHTGLHPSQLPSRPLTSRSLPSRWHNRMWLYMDCDTGRPDRRKSIRKTDSRRRSSRNSLLLMLRARPRTRTNGHRAKYVVLPIRRSEEHTSELQSLRHLVCRLLLE